MTIGPGRIVTFDKFEGFGHLNIDQQAARIVYHDGPCGRDHAPEGWWCTRDAGHEGPCAAISTSFWRNVWRFLQESW